MKKKKTIYIVSSALCLCLILALLGIFLIPRLLEKKAIKAELQLIQETAGSHDSYFLSTYPIHEFSEEDFHVYEGLSLLKSSQVIPNAEVLKTYFSVIQGAGQPVRKIYLGLDPAKVSAQEAVTLISAFPETDFSIFLNPRSLEQWKGTNNREDLLSAYLDLTKALTPLPRVKVYPFFAQEWIIANPENYLEGKELRQDVSQRIYLYALFAEPTRDCSIRQGEEDALFAQFQSLISDAVSGDFFFPDLSSRRIVFLGDSVIGNFTDRRSIPAYLHDLAGADAYNCGWGGATASNASQRSLHFVLDALISCDPELLPADTQAYIGLSELLSRESLASLNRQGTIFVLHYGINDYYQGIPLETTAPLDPGSYGGAMRNGIERLKKAFPQATILVMIPNHVFAYQEGMEVVGEQGSIYEKYIDTLTEIAKAYDLPVLDAYHQIIDSEKSYVHVDDGTHPNDCGRFQIAYALMHLIEDCLGTAEE